MLYDPKRITYFAETDARGKRMKFGIKAEDRAKHVYVIGKTGMGKSTMLENMAVQDIKNGEGMAFMDPHGSSAEKILEYIPEERLKDVLYFAPFDMENPVSFNVMEDVGPDKRHLVVSGLMSTFKKIWVDAWSARMEYILSNTLLALLEYPGSTLLGVNRMLSDKDYRNAVVANVKDPSVKSFWVDEFAKYNERYMQEAGDAIKNKIGQFTANPLIRNIIGQPTSSFDMRQFMDERKILIVNLSKGLIGETNANLLGSMLITKIYLSAMSRADLQATTLKSMPNFYFYVDEFQSFANEAFANILSEARKYKLNLTIAHQYIEQMEEEVRNAVFGNVGTTIAFRVGPFDAEVLETIFTPEFLATDIVNLGFAQIYLSLMIDGIGSRPFSAVTLPPIPQSKISYKDMVLAASRKQFSRPRSEIEASIGKWHEPLPKPVIPKRETVDAPKVTSKEPMAASASRVDWEKSIEKKAPIVRPVYPNNEQKQVAAPQVGQVIAQRIVQKQAHTAPVVSAPVMVPIVSIPTTAPALEVVAEPVVSRTHSTPAPARHVQKPYEQKFARTSPEKKLENKEQSTAELKSMLSKFATPTHVVKKPMPNEAAKNDLRSALAAVMKSQVVSAPTPPAVESPVLEKTVPSVTVSPSPQEVEVPERKVVPPPHVHAHTPTHTSAHTPAHTHVSSPMHMPAHSLAHASSPSEERKTIEKLERILRGKH